MTDRIVRHHAKRIGLSRGFSAHSMRATFITRTLENGASLEEVQRAAGHADASTTKLYDRRGCNLARSASTFTRTALEEVPAQPRPPRRRKECCMPTLRGGD